MTKTSKKFNANTKKTQSYFTIASVVLMALPLLSYFFLVNLSKEKNMTIIELFRVDIVLTVNMMATLSSVFLAYLIHINKQQLTDKKNKEIVVIGLVILCISQVLVLNSISMGITLYLIYLCFSNLNLTLKQVFKDIKVKIKNPQLMGCYSILMFNFVLMLISLRLNFS